MKVTVNMYDVIYGWPDVLMRVIVKATHETHAIALAGDMLAEEYGISREILAEAEEIDATLVDTLGIYEEDNN
jgi:hypothetical protein